METLTLNAPIATASVRVARLTLDWDAAGIWIVLRAPDNREVIYTYSGATATTLMKALNTANLSLKSLHRRIIEKLTADFPELAGAVAGAPD